MGRLLLCRGADQRVDQASLGSHSGSGESGRHGQGHRDRAAQDAYRRSGGTPQAHIDSGKETIVGVKYRLPKEDPLEILSIDNNGGARIAGATPAKLRANRDEAKVKACLNAITEAA